MKKINRFVCLLLCIIMLFSMRVSVVNADILSIEQAIEDVNKSITYISTNRSLGMAVSKLDIQLLEDRLNKLYRFAFYANDEVRDEISDILDRAYEAADGVVFNADGGDTKKFLEKVKEIKKSLNMSPPVVEETGTASGKPLEKVLCFSDVPKSYWGYDSIMDMTNRGYFTGTGEIIDGVGIFEPESIMTGAEFLTVVARILFGEENILRKPSDEWWEPYYNALEGILVENKVATTDAISREQMAYVAVKALEYLGEDIPELHEPEEEPIRLDDYYLYMEEPSISEEKTIILPDEGYIDAKFVKYVKAAYARGILVGVDDIGTFSPKSKLNRASATMVLYRIVDKTKREAVDMDKFLQTDAATTDRTPGGFLSVDPDNGYKVPYELRNSDDPEPITIYEGQYRQNRPAKEGDIFIKKDGTQVVVQKDQYGIVGGGQGLQLDVGLDYMGVICTTRDTFIYGGQNLGGAYKGLRWTDSTGESLNNQDYRANRTTGEAHWDYEWDYLRSQISRPAYQGKDGEVSQDAYHLYVYDEIMDMWVYNNI